MKFKEITIERNFHIINDDRFIMEKIHATIQLDDFDDEQLAMNTARAQIVENFKKAYPNVYVHLNFNESQIFKEHDSVGLPLPKDYVDAPNVKIKKMTLEEQIQSCTTIEALNTFKIIAGMNPKLQDIWDEKYIELTGELILNQK